MKMQQQTEKKIIYFQRNSNDVKVNSRAERTMRKEISKIKG